MKTSDVFTPVSTPDILRVTQAGHSFAVGDAVRRDGSLSSYVAAMGDTGDNAEAVGLISYVNGDDFIITLCGPITGLSGLTDGQVYKLSWNTPGGLTGEAIPAGAIDKPLLLATSSTGGIVLQMRGAMALVTGEPSSTLTYKPTLTVGQTVIMLPWNYTVGVDQLLVVKNGIIQSDYTETGINEITLAVATVYGDVVSVMRMPNGCVPQTIGVPSMKNKIINGCMRLAQRGTSLSVGQAASSYLLDRFFMQCSHDAGNITVSQETEVPNSNFQYSLKATNAAGNDTSVGASQYLTLQQRIEGYNIAPLRNSVVTLSFWVRSSKVGIYGIAFLSAGVDRSYIREYTINVANTWEYKQVNVDLSAVVGGTWNYTNGIGLLAYFTLVAGTTFQTTKDAWQSGIYFSTANQVNWLNETNTFYLTGIQLEGAESATEFEVRSFADELRYCQRYFEKSYAVDVAPATATTLGIYQGHFWNNSNWWGQHISYKTPKRAPATVGLYDGAGNSSRFSQYLASAWTHNAGTISVIEQSTNNFMCYETAGTAGAVHYVAEAEL